MAAGMAKIADGAESLAFPPLAGEITALSRIRWLFVIARNSTFTYKGQAIDM